MGVPAEPEHFGGQFVEGRDTARAGRPVDGVTAAVDVDRFTGDRPRRIVGEDCGSGADVVDPDEARTRRS